MPDFFSSALKKIDKFYPGQIKELLVNSVNRINLLRNVINSIDAGILVCDENNSLIMANKHAKRLIPITNFIEGIKLWSAIKDEGLSVFFNEVLNKGERVIEREMEIFYHDNAKLLSVSVVPLVEDSGIKNTIKGNLIYIENITEKRKEESRQRRMENLASLTTLAAGVAHEIKNPLGSISIHLQLLQKALSKKNINDKKTDKYLKVLKEEVDRLNKIVIDFLFAVRPLSLELRECDINKLIMDLMNFLIYELDSSKIKCMLELDDKIPLVLLDERLMKQVLMNLINNAKKAMPEGGVLTIASNYKDNEIKISVIDTGVGINKEDQSKIFEPYFTTDTTGTGLGLTMSYKIIREHQGEITVDSEPGGGAEFKIILPVPQRDTKLLGYSNQCS